MTVRADLGKKTLFWTNWCPLLKIAKKLWAQCENDKSVLISGWKRCFVQTHALCWKALQRCGPNAKMTKACHIGLETQFCTNSCTLLKTQKSGVLRAKMTKHVDLGLKTLFCTNSCTLLKIANKWGAQWENDKTCWSRVNTAVLDNLVQFAERS